MTEQAKEVLQKALGLPPEVRAAIAGSLIRSLEEPVDEKSEEAWAIEIEKRIREFDAGTLETVSWPDVRRELMAR